MDKNAQCYFNSAKKLRLPVTYDSFIDGLIISLGKKRYYIFQRLTPLNNQSSSVFCMNKYSFYHVLKNFSLPVPKTTTLDVNQFKDGQLKKTIRDFSFPLVVKPLSGGFGEDVLCNIQNMEDLTDYLEDKYQEYNALLIQEFHGNLKSYRILVLNNKVIGLILRYPAHVIGDGQHNLEELIELTNIERKKTSDTLGPILVDLECKTRLKELNIDLYYIPPQGERVILGYTSNATRGGTYISIKNKMCKENKLLFAKAAKALDLNFVGFDVECVDINLPIETTGGVIIEANQGPSIRIHENPMEGIKVHISKKILFQLIYRHPFAYLSLLFRDMRTQVYVRSGIVLFIFYMFSKLISV